MVSLEQFSGDFEVALVYYRSAYDPKHFYNEDVREIIGKNK
jgi:hypothetical protein